MNKSPPSFIIQNTKSPMHVKLCAYRTCKEDGCHSAKDILVFTGASWAKTKRCRPCPQKTHNITRKRFNIRQFDIRQCPKWKERKILETKGGEKRSTLVCQGVRDLEAKRDWRHHLKERGADIFQRPEGQGAGWQAIYNLRWGDWALGSQRLSLGDTKCVIGSGIYSKNSIGQAARVPSLAPHSLLPRSRDAFLGRSPS